MRRGPPAASRHSGGMRAGNPRRIDVPAGGRRSIAAAILLAFALAGCQVEGNAGAVASDGASFRSTSVEALVGPNGACLSAGNADPRAARPGMSTCDLVRVLGRPQDVVVSTLPDGRKRVSMFYPGSGGTTRSYTFVDDKLISTPPGVLKENYAGRQ